MIIQCKTWAKENRRWRKVDRDKAEWISRKSGRWWSEKLLLYLVRAVQRELKRPVKMY